MKKAIMFVMITSSSIANADPYIGLGAAKINGDLDGWGSSVFLGYEFSEFLSAEFSIDNAQTNGAHTFTQATEEFIAEDLAISEVRIRESSRGFSAAILPTLPINDSLDIYMSLAYRYQTVTTEISSNSGYQRSGTNDETGFDIGAGLKWNLSDRMFLRGSVNTSAEDFGDAVTMGVDLGINF